MIEFNVKAKSTKPSLLPILNYEEYNLYREKGFSLKILSGGEVIGTLSPVSVQSESHIEELISKYNLFADPSEKVLLYKSFVVKGASCTIITKRAPSIEELKKILLPYIDPKVYHPVGFGFNWVALPYGWTEND